MFLVMTQGKYTFLVMTQGFLRYFRDPIRLPRISNRVPRVRENHDRVPKLRKNRVPIDPNRVPNIFLTKPWYTVCYVIKYLGMT